MIVVELLPLAFSWLAYFAIHSQLASLAVKHFVAARWSAWMPAYRLVFNLVAVVLLLVPMLGGGKGRPVWSTPLASTTQWFLLY